MRGKAVASHDGACKYGITPAYAGKSMNAYIFVHFAEDHPRLCGEKQAHNMNFGGRLGSPPPMRGKGGKTLDAVDLIGITPAYAGKRN